ncbi:antibiotic resistance efflux pump component [Neisseria gonorrhoeae]|nr:antibiotic resistance efflux pump component [Neisseria gonorrhoeae]
MRASGLFDPSTVRAGGLEDSPQLKNRHQPCRSGGARHFVCRHPHRIGKRAEFVLCQRLPEPRPSATRDGAGRRGCPYAACRYFEPDRAEQIRRRRTAFHHCYCFLGKRYGTERTLQRLSLDEAVASPATGVSTGQAMAAVQKWLTNWAAVTASNGADSRAKRQKAARKP